MSGSLDPDPSAFGRLERRRRLRIAGVIALMLLLPLGWLVVREVQVRNARQQALLTAAQRAKLTALLDRREALAQQRLVAWNTAAHRESLGGLTPTATDCPLVLQPPAQFSAGAFVKYATHDEHFGTWKLCILRPEVAAEACGLSYLAPPEVVELRTRLAQGEVFTWDLERAVAAPPEEDPPRAVVLVDTEVRGKLESALVGHISFVPGSLTGHGFLFSPQAGRFICAGPVSVRNSKSVEIEYSHFGDDPSQQQVQAEAEGKQALERDLEVQLRFALPRAWHALEVR